MDAATREHVAGTDAAAALSRNVLDSLASMPGAQMMWR